MTYAALPLPASVNWANRLSRLVEVVYICLCIYTTIIFLLTLTSPTAGRNLGEALFRFALKGFSPFLAWLLVRRALNSPDFSKPSLILRVLNPVTISLFWLLVLLWSFLLLGVTSRFLPTVLGIIAPLILIYLATYLSLFFLYILLRTKKYYRKAPWFAAVVFNVAIIPLQVFLVAQIYHPVYPRQQAPISSNNSQSRNLKLVGTPVRAVFNFIF